MKKLACGLSLIFLGLANAQAALVTYDVRDITSTSFVDYKAGFNAQGSTITSTSLADFNNLAGRNNGYDHLSLSFDVSSANAGQTLNFQLAPDAGYGGAAYLDGVLLTMTHNDLWWGGSWNNLSQLLTVSLASIAGGTHTLDFYWAEGCCNGNGSGRFSVGSGAYQNMSVANLNALAVPEPGSLALLGAGLAAACAARRRKSA